MISSISARRSFISTFNSKSTLTFLLLLLLGSIYSSSVFAANWFKLRGTEPGGTAHTLQVWGFLQPAFAHDYSDPIEGAQKATGQPVPINGHIAVPGTLPPARATQDSFYMRRARLGVRGTMVPINNDIDYFILTEFGQNGTNRQGHEMVMLDASVTFNQMARGKDDNELHNLGARFRVGQFLFSQTSESLSHSTPGRRVHMWMPEATLANGLTRRVADNGPGNFDDVKVNGGRDIGIEVFDFVEFGNPDKPFEFTYSAAIGNGDTIGSMNQDDNYRTYYWLSFGQLLDNTRGPRRHDWMVYGWYQNGDINFNDDINNNGISDNNEINAVNGLATSAADRTTDQDRIDYRANAEDYRQEYMGAGFEYFDKVGSSQLRFNAEYQVMKGLVFDGVQSPSSLFNNASRNAGVPLGIRYDPKSENTGWYVDVGYDINHWWKGSKRTTINLRHDVFDRNTENAKRSVQFNTTSFSMEYFFHKKARMTFTYQLRDFNADDRTDGTTPAIVGGAVMDSIGNRVGLQVTYIFKNVLLR